VSFFEEYVSSLSRRIVEVDHRPVLVGIDGQGGSGKSTLARELGATLELSSAVVEGDDFYSDLPEEAMASLDAAGGYEHYFDWRRLQSEVLVSVKDNAPTLRYRRHNWDQTTTREWIELPLPEVVIVEGVYSLRPELREYYDLTLFVLTSEPIRLQRQIHRAENSDAWIQRWLSAEELYVSLERPHVVADIVIEGG
jgi:uridine kinase